MKTKLILLSALACFFLGCAKPSPPAGAIRVSVFYPKKEGGRFDWGYYTEKHLPLVSARFGSAMKTLVIEEGLGGGAKDVPPAFVAIAHMTFDSLESFQAATAPHTAEVMGDIPKFTTIEPVIQISRIKIAK